MANIITQFLSRAKSSLMDENSEHLNMFLIILALAFIIMFIVAVCQVQKRNCSRIDLGLQPVFL